MAATNQAGSAPPSIYGTRVFIDEVGSSTSFDGEAMFSEQTASTRNSIVRRFALGCALGVSNVMPIVMPIGLGSGARYVSGSTGANSQLESPVIGYITELRAWLQRFWHVSNFGDHDKEITSYVHRQMSKDFPSYSRALKSLAVSGRKDVPTEAVAQILIDSADFADADQAIMLGASIEQYLDSDVPLLVDAAAKSLAPGRLGYNHAARRMQRAADNTRFKYLRKKLTRVSQQLAEEKHGEVRSEA